MKDKILIYGSTGYTGRMLAKRLLKIKVKPVLGARDENVSDMAQELDCETRVFPVEDASRHLDQIGVLINLAGPFANTQSQLIEACLQTRTHYMDIAGEVPEVKAAFAYQDQARKKEIAIVPAAGFGVAPTDIAAKLAAGLIENPTHLTIAYATEGGVSRGTLRTVLWDIHKPGVILRNGKFTSALPAHSAVKIQVGEKLKTAVYNPWRADLYTAYESTGIPNIETFAVFPGFAVRMMKGKLGWLRKLMLKRLINLLPIGPSAKQLEKGFTVVEAIAKNEAGKVGKVRIKGPEAYVFTMETLILIAEKLKKGGGGPGVLTPSDLGVDWLEGIEGVQAKIFQS